VSVAADPLYQRPPWRALARKIADGPRPAVVVVTPAHGIVPLRAYRSELRPLSGPVTVRDVVVATVAAKTRAGADATLPSADPRPSPGPQFTLAHRTRTRTYEVLSFHAAEPVALTPGSAGAGRLTPEPAAVISIPASSG
jgi:hypothetical protein